jgi:hypothetical protein
MVNEWQADTTLVDSFVQVLAAPSKAVQPF